MALYYSLQVYKDVYALVLRLFQYTRDFPKEYKYSLGEDIRRDSVILVRSIYRANKSYDKSQDLEAFLDDFEVLKFEVRLSMDLHLLSIKHFSEISTLMDTIGKEINGWKKAVR